MTSRAPQAGFQDWAELRAHAIDLFGETPHPTSEEEIIRAYELHPDAVERAITSIAIDVTTGTVRSGWGVLRKRAATIAAPTSNPTRPASLDREKAIARAEQWIRAAGIHIDRPDEILDELFGDAGQLRAYAQVDFIHTEGVGWHFTEPRGDTALTTRILDLWAEQRPTGMAIEREGEARAEKWKADQARLADMHVQALAQLDNAQTHLKPLPDADYSATEDLVAATPNDDIPF